MSDLSAFSESEVWNAIFKSTAASLDTGDVYVSLHTADEGNAPDGSNEVSESSYSRVAVPTTNWDVTGNGPITAENNSEINFGDPTGNWGTVSHFALWTEDQGVSGEEALTATVALDSSEAIDSNTDEVRFDPTDLTAQLD